MTMTDTESESDQRESAHTSISGMSTSSETSNITYDEEAGEECPPQDLNSTQDRGWADKCHVAQPSFPLPVGDVTCCLPKHGMIKNPLDVIVVLWRWFRLNKSQILSGVTVSLAQVPEAISFSFLAGVDPIVGLQSAWIMGLASSLVGGRPGMVSGATGAVSVVLTSLIRVHGLGYLFYAIMLAGILQMIFGLLRLGVLVRMVPHPVMVGFCTSLGLIIGFAQFADFKVPNSQLNASNNRRLEAIGSVFIPLTDGKPWVDPTMALWMLGIVGVTITTCVIIPKLTKAIPGSLAGIIVATIVEWGLIRQTGFHTNTVGDNASVAGAFPVPIWIDTRYGYSSLIPPFNAETLKIILPTSITAGAVGLLESLLTLQIIDDLTNTKGNENREAFGQGVGMFISGMFGGMGGCTTIGQSIMNIHSGGCTRLSSTVAALFMLCTILVAYPLINLIPVAGLVGVMLVMMFYTVEWGCVIILLSSALPERLREKFGLHSKVKRTDAIVVVAVIAATLILNLAIGVAVGIATACIVFAWDAGTRLSLDREVSEDGEKVVYTIHGPLFFAAVKPLLDMFPDPADDPKTVTILLERAELYDWSGMVALKALHERMDRVGATVEFRSLSVASHKLMAKSARLWEGMDILCVEDVDVDHDPLVSTRPHREVQYAL